LQATLNGAQPGDSILLAAGSRWQGNFVLPDKACGAGITLATDMPHLPQGTRVTPATAANFAVLTSPNSEPALRAASPSKCWRLESFAVTGTLAVTSVQYGLVRLGDGGWVAGGQVQTSLDKVPTGFLLSHLYIHGTPTLNLTRCLEIQSGNTIVRDSWLSECHGKGFDAQAIEGWNGTGLYLIRNNFLEGSGENIMFGGAAPGIFGLIPADITIERNHFYKNPAWQGVWTIKNLLEFKAAKRVLVRQNVWQNVFDKIWPSGQEGMAVVVKSNQGDETNPQSLPYGTTDVTITGNVGDTAAVGIDVHAKDCYPTCPSVWTSRVLIQGNLWRHVMKVFPWTTSASGRGAGMLMTGVLKDITVVNNSFYHDPSLTNVGGSAITFDTGNREARGLRFSSNYWDGGAYGVFFGGKEGSAALDSMAGPGNWTFSNNALAYRPASKYPAGNTFPLASTLTPGVGVDITSVLSGVAGVVVPNPLAAPRSARRPRAVRPRLLPRDRSRLQHDPANPWAPSKKKEKW
jgi:hypothetical protein